MILSERSEIEILKGDTLSFRGIFIQMDIQNKNKRTYPSSIVIPEVDNYIETKVKRNRAVGELLHPYGDAKELEETINYYRVSHKITDLVLDGKNYIGTSTPIRGTVAGDILHSLLENGVVVGSSSRATGEAINGKVVRFNLITPSDIEYEPSAPDAFMSVLKESWFGEQVLDNIKYMERKNKINEAFKYALLNIK